MAGRRVDWWAMGVAALALIAPASAATQTLGTFRWQLQPYCNVVTVTVTQAGGVYRLEGTDDQCGAGRDQAAVQGLAFPNPDGTIGFGLTIVTAPGGAPVHVDADIALTTLSGTWRDSAGVTGDFAFTPGVGSGGNPRPLPLAIPPAIRLLASGGLLASGSPGVGAIPLSGAGTRLMWHPAKAALRAGGVTGNQWDDGNVGAYSTAVGFDATASGTYSIAMGSNSTASGNWSTALGNGTRASGNWSSALGYGTLASGEFSAAMGLRTVASGRASTATGETTTARSDWSTALGLLTVASGRASTAMGEGTTASSRQSLAAGFESVASGITAVALGDRVSAAGTGSVALGSNAVAQQDGSFVFADRSTTSQLFSTNANEFVVRVAGGARFFSNATQNLGPVLLPDAQDWSAASDVALKHRFRELDPEDILARLARMPVTEWSYKAQDSAIRHMGPTAQDFHAAFGLGQDPLRIGTLDADGVALAAVKALEARTRALPDRAGALETENTSLRVDLAALRERHDALARDNVDLLERLERLERLLARK